MSKSALYAPQSASLYQVSAHFSMPAGECIGLIGEAVQVLFKHSTGDALAMSINDLYSQADQVLLTLLEQAQSLNPETRMHALDALHWLDDNTRDTTINSLLTSSNAEIKGLTIETLVYIDPQQGLPRVLPYLSDPDPRVRWLICHMAIEFGDHTLTKIMANIAGTDADPDVRFWAIVFLERQGDITGLPVLASIQQNDPGVTFDLRPLANAAAEAMVAIRQRYPSAAEGP